MSVRTGLPRPLRNRVTPFGEIVVHPARGTLMGNRGCLHDAQGRIVRTSDRDAWISCVPTWPGVDRPLMTPGAYTELFFLDEATALAAGHRPCGQCRPEQLKAFKQAWRDAYGLGHLPRVAEIDCSLRRRAPEIAEDALPDGAIVEVGGQPLLRWRERWLPWRFTGYGEPVPVDPASARLISSGPMIRVLASGYVPAVHPTAETNTA